MPRRTNSGDIKQHKMIGWYDPIQLGRTAIEVLISTLLGRHADKRIMQALSDTGDLQEKCFYQVVKNPGEEFWFDYVSDVGDGFNSTYTTAYFLSRDGLELKVGASDTNNSKQPGDTHRLPRGELLVFGGDEVYPTAGFRTYKERLTSLYEAVFPKRKGKSEAEVEKSPALFAIPGNHDWYDSLVAFSDIFCSGKPFAGWQTKQNHSYFAIKLPRGWWLFGTDMQLGSSLDKAQIEYFSRVMKFVGPDDRIILCNAEPHWITAKMYEDEPAYNNRNMGYFEGGVLKRQVAIFVAGDRHYYRRHEEISNYSKKIDPKSRSKVQKIVAGGGGAFLHPTHRENVGTIGKRHIFELQESFPDEESSSRLTYWNLLFPLWNWKFGLLTGFLYLLTAQAFLVGLGRFSLENFLGAVGTVISVAITQPVALFWVVLIFAAFVLFTDPHSKIFRFTAGPVHAIAHLLSVFLIGWGAAFVVAGERSQSSLSLLELLLTAAIIFVFGAIIGPLIMGLYLLVSLNFFGKHHNEAFSSLKIPDYKCFLRFKINRAGDLTIFPVVIERVVRKWKAGIDGEPKLVPMNLKPENEPFLAEEPIHFEKPFEAVEVEDTHPELIRKQPL